MYDIPCIKYNLYFLYSIYVYDISAISATCAATASSAGVDLFLGLPTWSRGLNSCALFLFGGVLGAWKLRSNPGILTNWKNESDQLQIPTLW